MIYLDNAATTYPKPKSVIKAMADGMQLYGANPGRSGYRMSMRASQRIFMTREAIAEMFGAEGAQNVCFTLNCSYALNMAIKGLVNKGDHVITSNLEHNAVMRPLYTLKERNYLHYSRFNAFNTTEEEIIRQIKGLITVKTTCVICTSMSNVTGTALPLKAIGELCNEYGLRFIVDGAQGGGIIPINVEEMHIDCLCLPGHKGLYGPMGTGIMILNTDEKPTTLIEGGTGNLSRSLLQPDEPPERFESGTVNTVGIIALYEGVSLVKSKSIERIGAHEVELCARAYDLFEKAEGVILYTPRPVYPHYGAVLSFNIDGYKSEETAAYLAEKGIAVRAGLHCAPSAHEVLGTLDIGTVRISPSIFTTQQEIDRTVWELQRMK